MRYLLLLGAILCLLSFQLLGCGEDADRPTTEITETETVVTEISPEVPTPLTPETVFERLWNAFGGRFAGNKDNFRRLREITTSQIYLDYLAAAFPTETPIQTLEEYAQVAPPDPERYTPFLQEWVGEATAEDIAFVHWFIRSQREADFVITNLVGNHEIEGIPREQERVEELIDDAVFAFTKLTAPLEDPATHSFKDRHNIPDDEFSAVMLAFHATILIEDIAWLEDQIETHGTDTGLVWGAVYRPDLIGEILINFDLPERLHFWMNSTDLDERGLN